MKVDRESVVRSVRRVVRGLLRDGEGSKVFGVGKTLQEALVRRVREDVEKLSTAAEGKNVTSSCICQFNRACENLHTFYIFIAFLSPNNVFL